MDDALLSQHPVDRLVREMVAAPFDRRIIPVPTVLRELTYLHYGLGAPEDTLIYHLVKRVAGER